MVRCWYRTTYIWFCIIFVMQTGETNKHPVFISVHISFHLFHHYFKQKIKKKEYFINSDTLTFNFCWHSETWSRYVVTPIQHFVHIIECINNQTVEVLKFILFVVKWTNCTVWFTIYSKPFASHVWYIQAHCMWEIANCKRNGIWYIITRAGAEVSL